MRKLIRKNQTFTFPLNRKVVRNLRIVTEHIGDLEVTYTGYCNTAYSNLEPDERYSVDIESITFNGAEVLPLIDGLGSLDEIIESALNNCAYVFNHQTQAA